MINLEYWSLLNCQTKIAGHKTVNIFNIPRFPLQAMQDSVKYVLFLWIGLGISVQLKSTLNGAVNSHIPLIFFSNDTKSSMFSVFQEYTSQIQSQITKDFCCMKEYIERQEKNTLMFIDQEQSAAQQKIAQTIHQLCVEKNKLIDIKAQMEKGLGSDEMEWQNVSKKS